MGGVCSRPLSQFLSLSLGALEEKRSGEWLRVFGGGALPNKIHAGLLGIEYSVMGRSKVKRCRSRQRNKATTKKPPHILLEGPCSRMR